MKYFLVTCVPCQIFCFHSGLVTPKKHNIQMYLWWLLSTCSKHYKCIISKQNTTLEGDRIGFLGPASLLVVGWCWCSILVNISYREKKNPLWSSHLCTHTTISKPIMGQFFSYMVFRMIFWFQTFTWGIILNINFSVNFFQ